MVLVTFKAGGLTQLPSLSHHVHMHCGYVSSLFIIARVHYTAVAVNKGETCTWFDGGVNCRDKIRKKARDADICTPIHKSTCT